MVIIRFVLLTVLGASAVHLGAVTASWSLTAHAISDNVRWPSLRQMGPFHRRRGLSIRRQLCESASEILAGKLPILLAFGSFQ